MLEGKKAEVRKVIHLGRGAAGNPRAGSWGARHGGRGVSRWQERYIHTEMGQRGIKTPARGCHHGAG